MSCTFKRLRGNGRCRGGSQQCVGTMGSKSCDSRTKSSLELNCYCTSGLYTYKTSTRSRTTSATNSERYRTYKQMSHKYSTQLRPVYRQSSIRGCECNGAAKHRGPRMVTHNPVSPNPYSKATPLYQAVRDVPKPCITH
jgi:hypothetical protein